MKKLVKNRVITGVLRISMSGAQVLVIYMLLKYTGIIAAISGTSNQILLNSGLKDVDTASVPAAAEKFDYDFSVKSLSGEVFKMSEFKDKVLFINLWATWCGPCRTEMPAIQSLYDKIDDDEIKFIMLSIDNPGQEKKVKKYVEDKSYTFPVYTPAGYLTDQLAVPSIPTTFVVNKEGRIVVKRVGMTNFDTPKFKAYLEKLAE